jgi:hypothetical protein
MFLVGLGQCDCASGGSGSLSRCIRHELNDGLLCAWVGISSTGWCLPSSYCMHAAYAKVFLSCGMAGEMWVIGAARSLAFWLAQANDEPRWRNWCPAIPYGQVDDLESVRADNALGGGLSVVFRSVCVTPLVGICTSGDAALCSLFNVSL